jgi:hypothetical protein
VIIKPMIADHAISKLMMLPNAGLLTHAEMPRIVRLKDGRMPPGKHKIFENL